MSRLLAIKEGSRPDATKEEETYSVIELVDAQLELLMRDPSCECFVLRRGEKYILIEKQHKSEPPERIRNVGHKYLENRLIFTRLMIMFKFGIGRPTKETRISFAEIECPENTTWSIPLRVTFVPRPYNVE